MKRFAFMVCTGLVALNAVAAEKKAPAMEQQIDALVKSYAKHQLFSGTVLVAKQGKVLYQASMGEANKDHRVPNTLHTNYNIGSMGKTFTAVSIMQLVQAGKLQLSDTLGKVLPDFPFPEKDSITVQHLLNHTAGLPNYMEHKDYAAKSPQISAISDILPLIYDQKPLFAAGAQYRYSNSGMVLLGAVIEKVSGLSYPDYLQKHIFQPAGLQESGIIQEQDISPNRSIGYIRRIDNSFVGNVRSVPPASADGGMRATVIDLFKYDQALYGDILLNEASKKQMFTPSAQFPHYASGWETRVVHGHRFVGHSGGAPGVSAEFRRYVDDGYTLILLSNYDGGAGGITEGIEAILFGQPYQLATQTTADLALAFSLMYEEASRDALTMFDQVLVAAPEDMDALYMAARLRIIEKIELDKAVKSLQRYIGLADRIAAERQPSVAAAWWRMGNANELLGKREEARACYQNAVKLEPDFEEAKAALTKLDS